MTTKAAADYLTAAADDRLASYGGQYGQLATRCIADATDADRADAQYEAALSAFAQALNLKYEDEDEFFDAVEARQVAMTDAEVRDALHVAAGLAGR